MTKSGAGENFFGELGDGTERRRFRPGPVAGGARYSQVSVGNAHVCALQPAGIVRCWGENGRGSLGDGTTEDSFVPVLVAF